MSIEYPPCLRMRLLRPAALALALVSAGCAQPSEKPPSRSPLAAQADERGTPLPASCLAPPEHDTPGLLPTGCANDLNLQLMVERPADLRQGRAVGASMAAPVANAVERYVRPDDDPEQRRRVEKESVISNANVQ
jgi:hypothetical protein